MSLPFLGSLRFAPAPAAVPTAITPDDFCRAARGTLTFLGNPTEAASIDLAEQAAAWRTSVSSFAAHGLHWFFPHVALTECWKAQDRYDFTSLRDVVQSTLASDPSARLILRLRLKPPDWWLERHPDQILRYDDGALSIKLHWGTEVRSPSLASILWQRDVEQLFKALVRYVQQSDFADHVVGYHPALLHGGEWFQEGTLYNKKADYSPVMQEAFRAWLQAKYRGEIFAGSVVPTVLERKTGDIGHLRDPAKSRRVVDYYRFYHQRVATQAEDFCRVIKEATQGKAITGIYYGYSLTLAPRRGACQSSGHLALRQILDSPHIDYVSSMLDSESRRADAFGWSFGPIADAARVHNKIFFAEDEVRPWLDLREHKEFSYLERSKSPEENVDFLKRDFASVLAHGGHAELADLGSGWYDDPKIMDSIGRLARFAADPGWSRQPVAEIALFLDETAYFFQDEAHDADLNAPLLYASMPEYFHIGAPIDIHLFSDLTDGRVDLTGYKLIVLLNPWHVTERQREFIRTKVQRDGRWMLSFYAPGFLGRGAPSVEAIHDLIGIQMRMEEQPGHLTLKFDGRTYGSKEAVAPCFYADDAKAETLAQQASATRPAVSIRPFQNWTSVYSSVPIVPAGMLRQLAKRAGVHLFVESNDLVYATNGFVALRAGEDGTKHLRLTKTCDLYDPYEERMEARAVREFRFDMKKGETRMWRLDSVG